MYWDVILKLVPHGIATFDLFDPVWKQVFQQSLAAVLIRIFSSCLDRIAGESCTEIELASTKRAQQKWMLLARIRIGSQPS